MVLECHIGRNEITIVNILLVGGFNPFEKHYIVTMGSSSPSKGKHKKYSKPPPS